MIYKAKIHYLNFKPRTFCSEDLDFDNMTKIASFHCSNLRF